MLDERAQAIGIPTRLTEVGVTARSALLDWIDPRGRGRRTLNCAEIRTLNSVEFEC